MSNYNDNSSWSDKFSWIITIVAMVLVAILSIGLLCALFIQPKEDEQDEQAEVQQISVMDGAMEKFDTVFEEEIDRACLIHGDLNIANIMVKGSRLTGFIDPLNSMYADREYDLFQFDNIGGRHFGLSAAYREKYGASRRFAEKLAFYGLWNEVWCSIKVGHVINFIMDPLVKNMRAILSRL